jgi:hypothetical protein
MDPSLFRRSREQVEQLCLEAQRLIDHTAAMEAAERLKEAWESLDGFKHLAQGDVQERSVRNLGDQIHALSESIDDILTKREAGKAGDGNIALKCNWNDKGYRAPCSGEAYEFNVREGRAWCSSPDCKCRQYPEEVSLAHHPCYESIALREMYFGAGWDHTAGTSHPRHIHHVKPGRMAILTTRAPGDEEAERLVIGCLFIQRVEDDPGEETKIYGDRRRSISLPYNEIKVRFWDHYRNPEAPDIILWASGLFRYLTNDTVLSILKAIRQEYVATGMATKPVDDLVRHYEELAPH